MKITAAMKPYLPFTVIRDDREKEGYGWTFSPHTTKDKIKVCAGTRIARLGTGDYTLKGFESLLTIERKGSMAEFAGNMGSVAFEDELKRMANIKHSYVLLEFGMHDMANWPDSSKMRPADRMKLPFAHKDAALARFNELQFRYPYVHFQFVDFWGMEYAMSIFKRVIEHCVQGR
jgi:hypothetical protein